MDAPSDDPNAPPGESLHDRVLAIIRERGYERRVEPFQLSSGEWSHDYVDVKRALASGADLAVAARAIVSVASSRGASFDAIGGLTMGADALAHAVAVTAGTRWFCVRKEAKRHGKQRLIEGAALAAGEAVLVVDDVVTTGASIFRAIEAVGEAGARVALAVAVLDRGEATAKAMGERGIPYAPVLTYRDLGIEPVRA